MYVEEMNIFFSKPALGDPIRLIWNQVKEMQYPFIDCISHQRFNVIQLFGIDQFLLIDNDDSAHWKLFRKVQAEQLLNRTTGVFHFLEVGLLTYANPCDHEEETKTDQWGKSLGYQ